MPDSLGRLNVRETAKALGVHENTVRRLGREGRLAVERLPVSGFIRVRPEEVARFLAEEDVWRRPRRSGTEVRQRSCQVNVRFDDEEIKLLIQAARSARVSKAEVLRRAFFDREWA